MDAIFSTHLNDLEDTIIGDVNKPQKQAASERLVQEQMADHEDEMQQYETIDKGQRGGPEQIVGRSEGAAIRSGQETPRDG
jgi:hypothetical protein